MIKDPGAGLYPGESHAVLASGGCDLLPLFPAVFPAATANGMGLKRWKIPLFLNLLQSLQL